MVLMNDKSCAILNEISIKASLSLTNALLNMALVLSSITVSISINFSFQYQYQYKYQDQEKKIQE